MDGLHIFAFSNRAQWPLVTASIKTESTHSNLEAADFEAFYDTKKFKESNSGEFC